MKWNLTVDKHEGYRELAIGYTDKNGSEHTSGLRVFDKDVKGNPARVVKMLGMLLDHAENFRASHP